jgi:ribonucleoside-diphosphate reductase alpha chain
VRSQALTKLLEEKGKNTEEIWSTITVNGGSVQHLDFIDDHKKDVFKTAFELDQRWVVEHSADRASLVDQAQSVNIFLPADVHKRDLHQVHFQAWKKGLKSLYYCRSLSIQRAESSEAIGDTAKEEMLRAMAKAQENSDYEECLSCQ